MITHSLIFDKEENAGLTVYLHEASPEYSRVSSRPFVLVIPGGGYSFCSEREAEPIALNFLAQGYQAGVLRYHVGENRSFEKSLADADRALFEIHQHQNEWLIDKDKIAVIGFSAGGHLAAALSNLGKIKPSLCILGYPAILASFSKVMQIKAPSLESCVTKDTPPTFLFSTFEDNVVPIENSLLYLRALEENEVPFETHIFQKVRHGLSLATKYFGNSSEIVDPRFGNWLKEVVEWMELNWQEKEPMILGEDLSTWPIKVLIQEEENKAVLFSIFPDWQEAGFYKIIKNFNLQQLAGLAPERLTPEIITKLTTRFIKPKGE